MTFNVDDHGCTTHFLTDKQVHAPSCSPRPCHRRHQAPYPQSTERERVGQMIDFTTNNKQQTTNNTQHTTHTHTHLQHTNLSMHNQLPQKQLTLSIKLCHRLRGGVVVNRNFNCGCGAKFNLLTCVYSSAVARGNKSGDRWF